MYPETLEESSKRDETSTSPTSPLLPKNSVQDSVQESDSKCQKIPDSNNHLNGPHHLASYWSITQNQQNGNNSVENRRPQNFKGGCVRRLNSDHNSSSSMERHHPERQQRHNQHVKFNIGESPSDNLDVLQALLTNQHSSTDDEANSAPPPRNKSESSLVSENSEMVDPLCLSKAGHKDHHPREVLVELYDLHLKDESAPDGYWEEAARWIKYEEDVEGVDQRWGQPHVAFLSFHALLCLRKCMTRGIFVLDSQVNSFSSLCELIANTMASDGAACPNVATTRRIMQILQLRHNHVPTRKLSRISTAASSLFDLHRHSHYDRHSEQTLCQTVNETTEGNNCNSDNHIDTHNASRNSPARRSISASPLQHPFLQHQNLLALKRASIGEFDPNGPRRSFPHTPPTIDECDEDHTDSNANTVQSRDKRFSAPAIANLKLDIGSLRNENSSQKEMPNPEKMDVDTTPAAPNGMPKRRQSLTQFWSSALAELRRNTAASNASGTDLAHFKGDVVLRNLPEGSESCQVFVGAMKSLKRTRFVMIRLASPCYMAEIVDAPLPIRFVFVILGPPLTDGSYHELGRAISTLMSNKVGWIKFI
ncbi:band 3 cytoplasmic domain-containing protein [Ditylenchus destructor]|nr:band 3 cytoplasmic domain-containing protein [Ditylenchus destructor]